MDGEKAAEYISFRCIASMSNLEVHICSQWTLTPSRLHYSNTAGILP